jgi:hypothetical protein
MRPMMSFQRITDATPGHGAGVSCAVPASHRLSTVIVANRISRGVV